MQNTQKTVEKKDLKTAPAKGAAKDQDGSGKAGNQNHKTKKSAIRANLK